MVELDPSLPIPKKILVADDSGVCRMRLKAMCKRLYPGCSIVCVNDGDEAVASFEESARGGESFDLVLMDLNMVGDDDRPQLTGMLDARNGPQASARIRRIEETVSMDTGVDVPRSHVLVITGSTRTDRWDLAYYHGCGVDGFLSKPVTIHSLTEGVTAIQRKGNSDTADDSESGRNLGTALLGESPLFEQDSAAKIDMYIEPSLLEKASADPIAGPFSNLAGGESTFAALAAGVLPDDLSLGLEHHQPDPASHPPPQRRPSIPKKPPAQAKLHVPDGNDSDCSNPSPIPRVKHTRRMAPRLPRRNAGGSGDWGAEHAHAEHPPTAPTADEQSDAPAPPRRTSAPADAKHFALLSLDPTMLMMQEAVIHGDSLDHLITQAGAVADAAAKLGDDMQRVDVLVLTAAVGPDGALDKERVRSEAEAFWQMEAGRKPAGEAPKTTLAVLPQDAPADLKPADLGVTGLLRVPLRKLELVAALGEGFR